MPMWMEVGTKMAPEQCNIAVHIHHPEKQGILHSLKGAALALAPAGSHPRGCWSRSRVTGDGETAGSSSAARGK